MYVDADTRALESSTDPTKFQSKSHASLIYHRSHLLSIRHTHTVIVLFYKLGVAVILHPTVKLLITKLMRNY